MKREHIKTSLDLVTAEERRTLRDELVDRNRIRKEGMLPLLDIDSELEKAVGKLANDKFEDELDPYITEAFQHAPLRKGKFGTMLREKEVYDCAEARLRDDKEIVRGDAKGRRKCTVKFVLR